MPRTTDVRPVRRIYRFGDFEFSDVPLRLLHRGDEVDARAQSLRLLARLLGSVGVLVPIDEIVGNVWSNGSGDDGRIRVAMTHLRKALSGDGVQYIETLRGQGYRFVQPVEVEEQDLLRTRRRDAL